MDFLSQDIAPPAEPTEAELKAYFQEQADEFLEPARISFTHIYFNPDRRGNDHAQEDAAAVLAQLQSTHAPERAPQLGDRFLLNYDYIEQTPLQVRQLLGQEFADGIFPLSPGQWQGVIHSGYGYHLVRVSERIDEHLADFEQVRPAIRLKLLDRRQAAANKAFYQQLRARYTVRLAPDVVAQHPRLQQALTQEPLIGQELLPQEEVMELREVAE